ncbi:MAG: alpha-galactosidase, partial [Victivallales bacterium]|nr:alpha-galactosidase [Victivallales bacterium]
LRPISDACHAQGMLFGLWVEPEMANPDSDLYRAHPDWFLSDPKRPKFLKRNQLTLDFSQYHVRDWAIGWLDKLITDLKLDYLKWDMNRYLTEYGINRAMTIRYIQNLYAVWRFLNEKHPHVLFENCASGGGRADFGMVEFADRINRSDNAHPADVMILHEGFSRLFVPKTAGGAGNIAKDQDVPLRFRIHLGMTGSMSIGIDLLKASQETLDELRAATSYFKTVRADLQDSYVYRITSARRYSYCVWQYVRRDRKTFGLFGFTHGSREWEIVRQPRFKMRGLLPDAIYTAEDGTAYTGRELMSIGLSLPFKRLDYASFFKFFK